MARRLRFNGTGSGVGGCPAVHEDLDSGEIIIHGTPLTDPEDVAQLQHLGEGETPIVVPRELLVDFGTKEVTRTPHLIDLDDFGKLFENFEHTAWRLETRRRFASDETAPDFQAFVETGEAPLDLYHPFFTTIRNQTSAGQAVRASAHRGRSAHDRSALPPLQRQAELRDGRGHPQPVARGR